MERPIINIDQVTREFRMGGETVRALKGVSFSIMAGEFVAIMGVGASFIISRTAGWPVLVTPYSIVLSFVVCACTGIFFGWYPAVKASRLDPIEALRYE